jgi:single-strand DNA-binding protein
MKLIGICRLGRDAETRYTSTGEAVCGFSAAFDYGRKEGGRRPSQWVEFTLWGKRAEALAEQLRHVRHVQDLRFGAHGIL